MVRANLHGINTVRKRLADGTVRLYYYHRATGAPLPGKPGAPDFIAAYAAAELSMKDRHGGTFNGLVRDYTLSPEFGRLRDSTQREYRRMLAKAEKRFGQLPIAALNDPRVRQDFLKWRADVANASGDREADNRLSVISAMLTWARDNGQVHENHIAGFKRLHRADRADKIWLPEHINAFMRVAPIELQRALMIALHTGQRQGDILRLAWGNYANGELSLRQSKTGTKLVVPCTTALRGMLDRMERKSAVILTTKTGRPWEARHFKAQWAKASKLAGITDLHFHDLRGTAITMLSEAGCTPQAIASVTGHRLKSIDTILEVYLSRTRALAGEAVHRFENAKATQFANRLQTGTQNPIKGEAK